MRVCTCFYKILALCVFQIHGAQHGGSGPAVGSAGSAGHAHAAQLRTTDPGQEHEWSIRGRAKGV